MRFLFFLVAFALAVTSAKNLRDLKAGDDYAATSGTSEYSDDGYTAASDATSAVAGDDAEREDGDAR